MVSPRGLCFYAGFAVWMILLRVYACGDPSLLAGDVLICCSLLGSLVGGFVLGVFVGFVVG